MKWAMIAAIALAFGLFVVVAYSLLVAVDRADREAEERLRALEDGTHVRPGDWMPSDDWTKGVG